ncbi:putative 2-aminoethylphosphonate ABC transporter substrate-binding protein [Paenibacillus glycanilyticus]|uniref:putative 2-aminoethylphosphonate ABC transporter substrate-binding protein n=1 Tax=Paenibacillus glycanilyticus TaxID=126569 RepID=UPI0020418842|nr:putative 2-aminoethylphosphonate ABC transporter substrate-binding protein [Paenibacillus glycanilyticus]MCM3630153.1 putative 2-aminoethylphosphonate ABC transporter substrate-binding protein [Paenibacillus glycanilyticus]
MKKWMGTALATVLIISALTACGGKTNNTNGEQGVNGNKPAGASSEITVYTALEDDQIQTYLESYKAANPNVKVNIVRDSTGVITAKLLAEKDNPVADVVWGTAATSLLVLDQNKMLEGYSPKGIENIQPEFKDTQEPAHWVGIDAWETAFAVNTAELEKKGLEVPKSYADLIKPEYKGMIVMPNPASSGTGFLTVNGLQQLMGDSEAWSYLDKLDQNIAVYTESGSKPAKMAGTGEYPIGISFGYRAIQEKKGGAPVEVVFPTEGSGWDVEANALIKKDTIKPEAKAFLDWAISEEPMKKYNENYAILAMKSDSSVIPEGYSKDPISQLIKLNLNKAAENRDATLAEWTKRYEAKSEKQ